MRRKAYEKFILIIEFGAIYLLSFFNGTLESTLNAPHVTPFMVRLMKDCFQTIHLQGTKLKYVTMQLNTFVNSARKLERDVIWLKG